MARRKSGRRFAVGMGAGWLLAYFFDPRLGNRRRKVGLDWTLGRVRRGLRRGERAQRYATSTVYGKTQAVLHRREPLPAELNAVLVAEPARRCGRKSAGLRRRGSA